MRTEVETKIVVGNDHGIGVVVWKRHYVEEIVISDRCRGCIAYDKCRLSWKEVVADRLVDQYVLRSNGVWTHVADGADVPKEGILDGKWCA